MPCCFENHSGLIAFIVCCESGIENKKKPGRHVEMLGMFDHALVLPINPVMNQRLLSVLVKPEQHCVHLPAQSYRPVGEDETGAGSWRSSCARCFHANVFLFCCFHVYVISAA